ncbi:cytochrome P450 [Lentinus brumalis]|uniref:Cytochrome P450 n=1 Tax=Lentinus brumalis TaxID=2498619 RepID=A0A371DQJ5_9APHY|nr:cytochrome P450 [Polyporus brumalis]
MSRVHLPALPPLTLTLILETTAALVVCATAVLLLRRLVFHPLARFPGPKLAAASWWYMTYYEVFKDGAFVEHLLHLHARYGPVVRVGPNQLHFNALNAYDDIYLHGHRFTKDPRMYLSLNQSDSSLCIVDLKEIKTRREILGPLFSRRAIIKLEHVVLSKVNRLIEQLGHYAEAGKPANIRRACRSAALELIYAYCFATHEDFVTAPDFSHKFVVESEMTFPLVHHFVHFPWMLPLLVLQTQIAAWFKPGGEGGVLYDSYGGLKSKIDELVAHPEMVDRDEHETVFNHLLRPHPDKGQLEVPSTKVLWEEAINLIAAGSETVATIVNVGMFYVLNDPAVYVKLTAELTSAWPEVQTTMHYETLEKLPYLTAVVKESLRIGHGLVHPLPRVVGPTDAVIAGFTVPAGAVVAMGATFVHFNPTVFPQPHAFMPERWLGKDKGHLDQYLVAFSKGPRTCLGINLAWCELYLFFGYLFRKLHMTLHETTIDDMAYRCHLTPTFWGRMLHCKVKVRND